MTFYNETYRLKIHWWLNVKERVALKRPELNQRYGNAACCPFSSETPSPVVMSGPGRRWDCQCSRCTLLSLEEGDRAKVFTVRLMITNNAFKTESEWFLKSLGIYFHFPRLRQRPWNYAKPIKPYQILTFWFRATALSSTHWSAAAKVVFWSFSPSCSHHWCHFCHLVVILWYF